jgi:glutathione S-transferase
MSSDSNPPITLFHYPGSIYSARVLWYLHLRHLPYTSCLQPPYLPRPDLSCLQISYRRIPIAAIGSAIYRDSRLIIATLERLYPSSPLSCPTSFSAGISHLFESWSIDGGLSKRAVQLLPYWSMPFLQDPKFVEDRAQMSGKRLEAGTMAKGRPEALAHMRRAFGVMERMLADGRRWMLGTEGVSVADVEAVWVFQWMVTLEGALDGGGIDREAFPKTFEYIERFLNKAKEAEKEAPKARKVDIEFVREQLNRDGEGDDALLVDPQDPLKLKKGDEVKIWPIDSGFNNRDRGTLIGLSVDEVVIRNASGIRLHFPRWNFRIEPIQPTPQINAVVPKNISPMRLI